MHRVLVLVVVLLAVPAAAAAGPRTTLSNCGHLVARPSEVVIACADANYVLAGLQWSSWGGSAARAVGHVRANDCTPYCAAGHFHSYPARVVADRPTRCGPTRIYLRLTIDFTGRRPTGYGASDVHTWTCQEARTP